MMATVQAGPYWWSVAAGAVLAVGLCWAARRWPGRWAVVPAVLIGLVLLVDAVAVGAELVGSGAWSASTSLPLALCDVAALVAVAACWSRAPLLVELTWFWGMAGTLQAVVTPDLDTGFPHREFFEYVAGHLGIVLAALYLVVGLRIAPRAGAALRVIAITLAYTAFVGVVDALTGANYMFLREPPPGWTLLSVLGPWPWYIPSAAAVGVALVLLLDLPFRAERRPRPILREAPASGA